MLINNLHNIYRKGRRRFRDFAYKALGLNKNEIRDKKNVVSFEDFLQAVVINVSFHYLIY